MRLLALLYLFFSITVLGSEIQIPALRSPVMDEAGFLSDADKEDLNQLAYEIYTHQGPQITILTVNDLQGYSIEDFSIRVAEKWQLGTKDKDNGLLITIAKAERQMRIEVGQGIEGELTDYESNQYINSILKPAFKAGKFHDGLRLVMQDVASKFNIKLEKGNNYIRRAPRRQLQIPAAVANLLPFILGALILIHILLRDRPGLRGVATGLTTAVLGAIGGATILFMIVLFLLGLVLGAIGLHNILFNLGTGGGGYGGGGGGGWSGGGGGFSGGGSSGNW